MADWWTKQSFSPSSRVMKPKPLVSLNHLTVPVVRIDLVLMMCCVRSAGRRTDRHNVLVMGGSRCPARRPRCDGDKTQKGLLAIRQAPNSSELVHALRACVAWT